MLCELNSNICWGRVRNNRHFATFLFLPDTKGDNTTNNLKNEKNQNMSFQLQLLSGFFLREVISAQDKNKKRIGRQSLPRLFCQQRQKTSHLHLLVNLAATSASYNTSKGVTSKTRRWMSSSLSTAVGLARHRRKRRYPSAAATRSYGRPPSCTQRSRRSCAQQRRTECSSRAG